VLQVHLVFVTKYRQAVFDGEAIEVLRRIVSGPFACELPTESFHLVAGELPQRRFQLRATKTAAENQIFLLEESALVAYIPALKDGALRQLG
jgi:hypothetical protein